MPDSLTAFLIGTPIDEKGESIWKRKKWNGSAICPGKNEEEKKEQAALRQEYLEAIRKSLTGTLENTYLVDEKGNKRKVQRRF